MCVYVCVCVCVRVVCVCVMCVMCMHVCGNTTQCKDKSMKLTVPVDSLHTAVESEPLLCAPGGQGPTVACSHVTERPHPDCVRRHTHTHTHTWMEG